MNRLIRAIFISMVVGVGLFILTKPAAAVECFMYSADVGYVCNSDPEPSIFIEPGTASASFLPRMLYARMADYTDVYPEPTTAVAPVRNAGDGYLFVTVNTAVTNAAGEQWYMINYGEYVQASDLTFATISEFTGTEVRAQPERPFGWMLVDYWFSSAPGAEPASGALKLPRYTLFEVYDAQEADDGWIWYNIGNGRWMRQTYVSLIDPKPRPEGIGPTDYWVEIDLYEQSLAAYEGDRMVFAGLISSGLNQWPTNEGLFQVWDRHAAVKMSGAEGKIDYYFIEDVPHTLFFDNDIALHGAYWHDRFGYKHSHGCVNLPPLAAEWIYKWSEKVDHDLWVWVHTSNPNTYFERYDPVATFAGP
jgi:hypothetical protein